MKISYNWLKQYIHPAPAPEKCAELLTNTGLEVEGTEEIESIPGGLKGLVIGEVISCEQHPNADRLKVTLVNTGSGEPAPIVCGAPNVAKGQKVVVALPGAVLYPSSGESFTIKKSKIRGEVSEGMICAEDEIGLGGSHDGIIVLPSDAPVGMPAAEYFKVEKDVVFEIGLTPNRTDAMSHFGVARDLRAALYENNEYQLIPPVPEVLPGSNQKMPVGVEIADPGGLKRYSGICIENVEVKESPDWLKNALKSIGQKPINNIVDISNYVMFELGQPLHAFDLKAIKGAKIVVGSSPEGTLFTTLDGVERKLDVMDLMISNASEPMCIAGVFGGLHSGVNNSTTGIFLESACFDSVKVRKTARRHGLKTDSSFRFERGTDPEATVFALERAAELILRLAGGNLVGAVYDWYPEPVEWKAVRLKFSNLDRLIGEKIDRNELEQILLLLGFRIESQTASEMKLSVPPFRTDVSQEADVTEEILRIYGYNKISIPRQFRASINILPKPDVWKIKNEISDQLSALGFSEILNNSLSPEAALSFAPESGGEAVKLLNPLSNELNVLRKSMISSMCETLSYNINRQQNNLALYEWGKVYGFDDKQFIENEMLSIAISGDLAPQNWHGKSSRADFFTLKGMLEAVLVKLGIPASAIAYREIAHPALNPAFEMQIQNKQAGVLGTLSEACRKHYDLPKNIWFAEINWKLIFELKKAQVLQIAEPSKFPAVRRDLALLLDKSVSFDALHQTAFKTENRLLKEVNLFDVYEGDKIEQGKKSYALSFTLLDDDKTLTDKQIEKTMDRLLQAFTQELGAKLRD